jgi:hypothetical protein
MLYKEPLAQLRDVTVVTLPLGERFGDTGALRLDEPADCWVKSDVVAFPWNRLVLDGRVLPPAQTRETPNYLAARVPAGRHSLGYAFDPPAMWRILRGVSFMAAIAWSLVVVMVFVMLRGPRFRGNGDEERQAGPLDAAKQKRTEETNRGHGCP